MLTLRRRTGPRPTTFRLNLTSRQAHGLISWIPLSGLTTSGQSITDRSLYAQDLAITGSLVGVHDEIVMHGVESNSTSEFFATPSPANKGITTGYTWHLVCNGANAPQSGNAYAQFYANGSAHFGFNWHHHTAGNEADMFHFNSGGGYERTGKLNTTLTANTWWWITGVWNGADLRCYVNGLLDKTSSAVTSLATLADTTGELWHVVGTNHVMRTAEFRLYNRALTPEEVWQLYDPRTRWDLYRPVRSIMVAVPAGATAYTLDTDAGVYAVTGTVAALTAGRQVSAGAGSYAVTGTAAALRRTAVCAAETGAWTWTGTAATLSRGLKVSADAGAYVMTGSDAALLYGYTMAVESGAFLWAGTPASLTAARNLAVQSGSYAWTGTDAALTYSNEGGADEHFLACMGVGH